MKTFRIFFFLLLFVWTINLFTQPQTGQSTSSYGKGRIKTIDGNKIHFSHITLGKDVFDYKPRGSITMQTLTISDVMTVEVQKGSYLYEAGAGSALFGILGSIAVVALIGPTGSDDWSTKEKARIIVISTTGTTMIGTLVGYAVKKYKTVYRNQRFDIDNR